MSAMLKMFNNKINLYLIMNIGINGAFPPYLMYISHDIVPSTGITIYLT